KKDACERAWVAITERINTSVDRHRQTVFIKISDGPLAAEGRSPPLFRNQIARQAIRRDIRTKGNNTYHIYTPESWRISRGARVRNLALQPLANTQDSAFGTQDYQLSRLAGSPAVIAQPSTCKFAPVM